MRFLSLFSGIGALDLGLAWAGWTVAGQVELEPFGLAVLAKHWPAVPRWTDVRELRADDVLARCGRVDAIVGGFPCQPHSVAGKRKGREDERHLWPEFARLVREIRPRWVLAENVPGLRTTAADEVLGDLEALGYACWPLVVGARHVGAPHRRARVWIVAYGHGHGREGERSGGLLDGLGPAQRDDADGRGIGPLGDPDHPRLEGRGRDAGDARDGGGSARREPADSGLPGDPTLARGWPARPGEPQREWEAPRLAYATGAGRGAVGQQAERTERADGGDPAGERDEAGQPQPGLGVPAHGPAGRLARRGASRMRRAQLKALGNAVVPQVVAEIGRAILAAEAS